MNVSIYLNIVRADTASCGQCCTTMYTVIKVTITAFMSTSNIYI